ncbi:hypothetical protein C8J57DRAFT_1231904 [Mycena rebaudengoi]|nr:hypothetical protein C8J57DRAFT_1231904 [Mycena rebaudengoi]
MKMNMNMNTLSTPHHGEKNRKTSHGERESFKDAWIERLVKAAVESGVKILSRKRKAIAEDDANPHARKKQTVSIPATGQADDNDAPESSTSTPTPTPTPSSAPPPTSSELATSDACLVGNPKQRSLHSFGWKKATPEDIAKYWKEANEAGAERRSNGCSSCD